MTPSIEGVNQHLISNVPPAPIVAGRRTEFSPQVGEKVVAVGVRRLGHGQMVTHRRRPSGSSSVDYLMGAGTSPARRSQRTQRIYECRPEVWSRQGGNVVIRRHTINDRGG